MSEPSKNPDEKKDTSADVKKNAAVDPLSADAFHAQKPALRLRVKRGVYRFKTHEEANAHWDKILEDSGLPKTY